MPRIGKIIRAARAIWLVVVFLFVVSPSSFAGDKGSPFAVQQGSLSEIQCFGHVAYRMGVGPWLTQSVGSYSVVLPLEIKTYDSRCKVLIGSQGILEIAPSTSFNLSENKASSLTLSVEAGSMLYSLADGTALNITIPQTKAFAQAGTTNRTSQTNSVSVFSSVAHMGILEVKENGEADIFNLKGQLLVRSDKTQEERIGTGRVLRIHNLSDDTNLPFSIETISGFVSLLGSKTNGASESDAKSIGAWRIFENGPVNKNTMEPERIVLPDNGDRWYPTGTLAEPRQRISPWMPPPRRRGDPYGDLGSVPPWDSGRRR